MNHKPDGLWNDVELGEIIDIFDHIRVPVNSRERAERQGKYPYYGASGIIDGIDGYLFDGEYVLVAEDGENLNSRKLPVAFMAKGQFWVNNHAHIIKGKKGIADDRFLIAWFAQADIKGFITGAAQPKLSQANLKRISLLAPPYSAQRKIAGVLSAYDDLIENNTRRIALLEEMAQSIYREWFVHFRFPGHEQAKFINSPMGKIPEGWRCVSLKEITTKIGSGATPRGGKEAYKTSGIHLIRSLNIYDNQFELKDLAFIDDEQAAQLDNVIVAERDILLNITGASVARCCMVPSYLLPARVNQHVAIIRIDPDLADPFFVLNTINSERHKRQILALAQGGATREALTKDTISNYEIVLPPMEVLARYSSVVADLFDQRELLQRKNNCLRTTRDILLPKLISGKLDVEALDIDVGQSLVEVVEKPPVVIPAAKPSPIEPKTAKGTPYKDDAAILCVLLDELDKLKTTRSNSEFLVQKHTFALKHRQRLSINSQFVAEKAGPWSQDLRYKAIFNAEGSGWLIFNPQTNTVYPGKQFARGLQHARTVLGKRYAEVAALARELVEFGEGKLERWMTLFKIVLDLKDAGKSVTRQAVQEGVDKWPGKRKKSDFHFDKVDEAITQMVQQQWFALD